MTPVAGAPATEPATAVGPHVGGAAPEARRPPGRPAPLLFVLGVVAVSIALLPPFALLARRWIVGEAFQFALLAYVAPALVVLGCSPATRERLAGWPPLHVSGQRWAEPAGARPRAKSDRLAPAGDRPGRGAFDPDAARAWLSLVVFLGVVLVWRIPPTIDAIASSWPLVLLQAVMLLGSGILLWSHLLDTDQSVLGTGRPRRMAMAALAMWAIWALSYLVGFSSHPMFPAYHHAAGSGLGVIADQELAVFLLLLIPGFVCVPVVFVNLLRWLRSQGATA